MHTQLLLIVVDRQDGPAKRDRCCRARRCSCLRDGSIPAVVIDGFKVCLEKRNALLWSRDQKSAEIGCQDETRRRGTGATRLWLQHKQLRTPHLSTSLSLCRNGSRGSPAGKSAFVSGGGQLSVHEAGRVCFHSCDKARAKLVGALRSSVRSEAQNDTVVNTTVCIRIGSDRMKRVGIMTTTSGSRQTFSCDQLAAE